MYLGEFLPFCLRSFASGPDEGSLISRLEMPDYRARVEHGFVVKVEGFDWNCPQHITPRYTESEVEQKMAELIEENRALREILKNSQDTPAKA